MNLQDLNLPSQWLRQVAGCSQYLLERLGAKYEYARQNDKGYPIGGVMKALVNEIEASSKILGTKIGANEEEITVEIALKRENVLSKQINNQAKLAFLIPKKEASNRVKRVFRAVISLTKNAIKNSAPRLIGVKEKRDAETIMTEEWNDALELLANEAKVISWEQDGSGKLLATRLSDLINTDPEFAEIVKDRIDYSENTPEIVVPEE